DEAREVEGIDDQYGDRQIEKGKAEQQRAEPERAAEPQAHGALSRSMKRCASNSGNVSTTTSAIATAAAAGQSTLSKNSCHSILPTISVPGPPNKSGITNSPTAGMKTSKAPAAMPGSDSGRITARKARHGRAPRSAAASRRLSSSRDNTP